jgi:hypothetical protein
MTRLDDWYDAQSGMTRAFAESLLMEIVGGALNDTLVNHQICYDFCEVFSNAMLREVSKA